MIPGIILGIVLIITDEDSAEIIDVNVKFTAGVADANLAHAECRLTTRMIQRINYALAA